MWFLVKKWIKWLVFFIHNSSQTFSQLCKYFVEYNDFEKVLMKWIKMILLYVLHGLNNIKKIMKNVCWKVFLPKLEISFIAATVSSILCHMLFCHADEE